MQAKNETQNSNSDAAFWFQNMRLIIKKGRKTNLEKKMPAFIARILFCLLTSPYQRMEKVIDSCANHTVPPVEMLWESQNSCIPLFFLKYLSNEEQMAGTGVKSGREHLGRMLDIWHSRAYNSKILQPGTELAWVYFSKDVQGRLSLILGRRGSFEVA